MPRWSESDVAKYAIRRAAVGAVDSTERKPDPVAALDKKPPARRERKSGVQVCITLIACRWRILDDDNSIAGFKALRDEVARSLGIDDGDNRISWKYGQVLAGNAEGTIVKIELLKGTENK